MARRATGARSKTKSPRGPSGLAASSSGSGANSPHSSLPHSLRSAPNADDDPLGAALHDWREAMWQAGHFVIGRAVIAVPATGPMAKFAVLHLALNIDTGSYVHGRWCVKLDFDDAAWFPSMIITLRPVPSSSPNAFDAAMNVLPCATKHTLPDSALDYWMVLAQYEGSSITRGQTDIQSAAPAPGLIKGDMEFPVVYTEPHEVASRMKLYERKLEIALKSIDLPSSKLVAAQRNAQGASTGTATRRSNPKPTKKKTAARKTISIPTETVLFTSICGMQLPNSWNTIHLSSDREWQIIEDEATILGFNLLAIHHFGLLRSVQYGAFLAALDGPFAHRSAWAFQHPPRTHADGSLMASPIGKITTSNNASGSSTSDLPSPTDLPLISSKPTRKSPVKKRKANLLAASSDGSADSDVGAQPKQSSPDSDTSAGEPWSDEQAKDSSADSDTSAAEPWSDDGK